MACTSNGMSLRDCAVGVGLTVEAEAAVYCEEQRCMRQQSAQRGGRCGVQLDGIGWVQIEDCADE